MGDLLPSGNVRQRPDFQRVVVRSVLFIAMVDVSEVAPNVYSISLVRPQHMVARGRYVVTIEEADGNLVSHSRTLILVHTGICITN